jgi:hypothetical protein
MSRDIPFDAFVTLLVFLVGLPAVVLQTLPGETRQLLAKRARHLVLDTALPFGGAVAIVAGSGLAVRLGRIDPDLVWTGTLAALLVLGLVSGVRIIRRYGRPESVVRLLEREALSGVARRGRPEEELLHDLVEFGRHCEPGRGREWVLETLQALAERTFADPRYRGDQLEDLIAGVVDLVVSGAERPSPRNLATASGILRRTLRALDKAQGDTFRQADALHAIHATSRLTRAALSTEPESSALRMVQALGVTGLRHPETSVAVSQVLYGMVAAALEVGKVLIAISALEHLITLLEANAPAEGELVADTLGAVAHFWASGATARAFARERLARIEGHLKSGLAAALEATEVHCAHRTLFRTADLVRALRASLAAESPPATPR